MKPFYLVDVVWLVVCLGLLAGCGTDPGKQSAGVRPNVVRAQELPELGDYLPPLDGERIELAPPKGWYVPPASSAYVVRVQKSDKDNYPSVIVTAEDCQDEAILNVSTDNVREFADQIALAAKKDKSAVRPMEIGKFVGAAYAKRAKVRTPVTRILDVLYLETVVAGRKYRLELRCEEGSLEKNQPYLFAVAKGIKFLQAGPEEEPQERSPEKAELKEKHQEGKQTKAEPRGEPEEQPKVKPKEEPKEKPKEKPEGEAKEEPKAKPKEKPKKKEGLDLDLDKLDELLK